MCSVQKVCKLRTIKAIRSNSGIFVYFFYEYFTKLYRKCENESFVTKIVCQDDAYSLKLKYVCESIDVCINCRNPLGIISNSIKCDVWTSMYDRIRSFRSDVI